MINYPMKTLTLDRLDIRILDELQKDGGLSNQVLAERVGLTAAPCLRRVRALHQMGVIRDTTVRLNRRKLNLNLMAIVHVRMDQHTSERFQEFEQAIANCGEILECYLITGHEADYQLKVAIPDMDHYHDFLLGKITRISGVSGVTSAFVMRRVVETTRLPLNYLESRLSQSG